MLLTTYVDEIAHDALSKRAEQMPVGSIIVKKTTRRTACSPPRR
jgi:hypothetical protein